MTAGGHQKFLFDRDFDKDEQEARARKAAEEAAKAAERKAQEAAEDEGYGEEEYAEPEPPPPPSYSQEDLDQAREEGRTQGRDEASRDMASAIEQRTAQTLEAINAQVNQILEAYAQDKEQHSRDAVAVAEVIVRKLFPAINMDKALSEIEHMIVEAMKRTSGSPQLIIRVSPDMHAEVEARANALAALRGREGTVNVIGDEEVQPGDARVEWDGGGMVRDTGLVWSEIDDIIERNLGERIDIPQGPADTHAKPEPVAAQDTPAAQTPEESIPPAPGPVEAETQPPAEPIPAEAEVENPAPVGENEDVHAESPDSADQHDHADAAPQDEPVTDEPVTDMSEADEPQEANGEAEQNTGPEAEASPQETAPPTAPAQDDDETDI